MFTKFWVTPALLIIPRELAGGGAAEADQYWRFSPGIKDNLVHRDRRQHLMLL